MTDEYRWSKRTPFPRELATMIARKASLMAASFEDLAVRQMVRDAQRALERGDSAAQIAREMDLPGGGGSKVLPFHLGHMPPNRFFTPAKLKIQELRDGRCRHGIKLSTNQRRLSGKNTEI